MFITEGEWDAAALVGAGIPVEQVISVPNGARERKRDADNDQGRELRGYEYVKDALRAGLGGAKRFVWCGDNDGPGHMLRADMVRLLGAARFDFVEWSEGCNDATTCCARTVPRQGGSGRGVARGQDHPD